MRTYVTFGGQHRPRRCRVIGKEYIVPKEILEGNKRAFIGEKYRDFNVDFPVALLDYPEFGCLSSVVVTLLLKLSMYVMKNDNDGIIPGERINDGKLQLHCVRAAKEYGDVMEALNELVEVGMAQLDTEGEQVKELRLNWAFQTTVQYRQDKRKDNRKKMAAYRAQKEPQQEGDPSESNP